jgi:hypothetical protein
MHDFALLESFVLSPTVRTVHKLGKQATPKNIKNKTKKKRSASSHKEEKKKQKKKVKETSRALWHESKETPTCLVLLL